MINKVVNKLRNPSPWKFFTPNAIYERLNEKKNNFYTFVEILQLCHWILKAVFDFKIKPGIPFNLYLKGCFLNSFHLNEIKFLYDLGFKSWKEISYFTPEIQSSYVHQKKRKFWPGNCKASIKKLGNKYETLKLANKKFVVSYILLKSHMANINKPSWWDKSLISNGIILKPNSGSKGKSLLKFWISDSVLCMKKLFGGNSNKVLRISTMDYSPNTVLQLWKNYFNRDEDVLAQPYILSSNKLSYSDNSVVVRVITEAGVSQIMNISISKSWMEIVVNSKHFIFENHNGYQIIIKNKTYKSKFNKSSIDTKNKIDECCKASIFMHSKLNAIDRVAWDWIPTDYGPKLLEGNSCFGLLIPQIFNQLELKNKSIR